MTPENLSVHRIVITAFTHAHAFGHCVAWWRIKIPSFSVFVCPSQDDHINDGTSFFFYAQDDRNQMLTTNVWVRQVSSFINIFFKNRNSFYHPAEDKTVVFKFSTWIYLISLFYQSTNFFQRLIPESWFTNLEQTRLNKSQPLPAPYKRLIHCINILNG